MPVTADTVTDVTVTAVTVTAVTVTVTGTVVYDTESDGRVGDRSPASFNLS